VIDFGIVAILAIQIAAAAVGIVAAMRMTTQVERIKDTRAEGKQEISDHKIAIDGLEKRMRSLSEQYEAAGKILDEVTAAANRHEDAIGNIEERLTSLRNSQSAKKRYEREPSQVPQSNGAVHQEDLVQQANNGLPPDFGRPAGG